MNIAPHISASGNWLPCDRFMELALYDAQEGYYTANIRAIGLRGDFSTSAAMSDLPARRLAHHWQEACKAFGRNLPIIEIGGGNGSLAAGICHAVGFRQRLRLRYYIVERSEKLRRLQTLAVGNKVRVYAEMARALRHAGGRAFIFSNELADAFPARRFVYLNGAWQELGLSLRDNRVRWTAHPCAGKLPVSAAFETWAQAGQCIEVHESYAQWYTAWQPLWTCGVFVTIDYGDVCSRLYYRKPLGSLRGYKAHTLLDAEELVPLAGHCDITADVNFTDLLQLAEGNNPADTVQLFTQREYLLPSADAADPVQQHLIASPGAGDHFRVLVIHRFEIP